MEANSTTIVEKKVPFACARNLSILPLFDEILPHLDLKKTLF
jgi:hypothetical protein